MNTKRSRKREKRSEPSPELLKQMEERIRIPRVCCRCLKKWENEETTNPHRCCCSDSCRKWLYRHGIDFPDWMPRRLEVEQVERGFEKDLTAYKVMLRANGGAH